MKDNITQKVLNKIKNKRIEPKAKWYFLLKDSFVWILFALSILIGALSTSAVIFNIKFSDWDVCGKVPGGRSCFFISVLPYFWILILVGLIFVSYYNLKHTKKGYKYSVVGIILLSLIASLVLGGVSYSLGMGEKMERRATQHLPFYKGLEGRRMQMWQKHPDNMLAGKIIKVYEKELDLEGLKQEIWKVTTENAKITPMVILEKGEMIRVIGQKREDRIFVAKYIMPWSKPGICKGEECERKFKEMRINIQKPTGF